MENTQFFELGAVVFGLTEVVKGLLPEKYKASVAPLCAVLLGAGMNVYLNGYSEENVVYGLTLGLAATGLYKAVKSTMRGA
jgi:hypothetical protein